jgi:adenylate cyclase
MIRLRRRQRVIKDDDRGMRISLRSKLLVFAIVIAVVPLVVAGRNMIRIAQDELKSSANSELVTTAEQIVAEINDRAERTWLAPLVLIRNAIDDERLGVREKIALLTLGIADIPEYAALQITVAGSSLPLAVINDGFSRRLEAAGLDPLAVLRQPTAVIEGWKDGTIFVADITQVAETDDWLATVVLPLRTRFAGAEATLSARIDLDRLRRFIEDHPFSKTGFVTVIDRNGRKLFDPAHTDLRDRAIVAEATGLLNKGASTIAVSPYTRPDGESMLGAFSFPRPFDWAVVVEKRQHDAYLPVERMLDSLIHWILGGLLVAIAAAVVFAFRISRPIIEIDRVAIEVAKGNFQARVQNVRSRDEIGELAERMNEMVVGLNERFQLQKFVSGGTMLAIRDAAAGIRLGGERRRVTMLFTDIRGYTAFSERVDPETVVEMLNLYFQHQADIVQAHGGDIDKFVGDQIVAVFQGERMAENAVRAALTIQDRMLELAREHPEWNLAIGIGINVGEVVMGAMGSTDRMDYTVLGDNVNLTARLCAHAGPGCILMTESACCAIAGCSDLVTLPLTPIAVKGKRDPVPVYEVRLRVAGELPDAAVH